MAAWKFLSSSFVQGILNYIPALRKTIEASPSQQPAEVEPSPSPVGVEPWKEEVDRWKQLADKTAAERDQLKREAGTLHDELQRLVKDLGQARTEAEASWKAREAELKKEAEQEVDEREKALQEKEEELEKLDAELKQARLERDDAQAVLDIRRMELDSANAIVGKDSLEEAEVLKLLGSLNEEISQTAKTMKDLVKIDKPPKAGNKVIADAAAAIEGWVGTSMPTLIAAQAKTNSLVVQAGLQTLATAFSMWIASSYSFMHEHDQVLDETYKYLMNGESQIVLGRWRTLTHRYAKQGMPNLINELTKMLVTDMSNLLVVAGCSVGQVDALMARKRDDLRRIVIAGIKFREAIGEEIISCDFETILVHPGDAYDTATMEESYDINMKSVRFEEGAPRKVLCTAGLGLRRCKKVTSEGKPESQWEVSLLHKPKVILDTMAVA